MATKYKTNKRKLSSLVKQQVPQYVLEDHPKFTEFLSSYYLFMESAELNLTDITAVDNILLELASGSISNGYIQLNQGTNATPGQIGRESLFVLNARGWSIDVTNGNHTSLDVAYELLEEDICASTYTITQYIVSGSAIEVGNKLYQTSDVWMPAEPGWYRLDGDGSIKFEVSGTYGEIISVDPCGV